MSFGVARRWRWMSGILRVQRGALLAIAVVFLCEGLGPVCADEAAAGPNIILFLADDLGWTDLGSFGNVFYETPNLDRLAAQGMRFTQAYAACQVCSPTRAALLTGRTPTRIGITDWIGQTTERAETDRKRNTSKNRNHLLLPAKNGAHLPAGTVTFANAFKEAGYRTFFLGKWHIGDPEAGFGPTDHGFEINIAGTARGGPYGPGKYFHPFGMPNIDSKPGDHLTDRMAEEAVKLIRQAGGAPFVMFFSFYDVHTPLMAKEHLKEKYKQKAQALAQAGPRFRPEPPRWNRQVHDHAVYAGMVEVMDDAVGTVVRALEELGIRENTVILFTSDNGGLSTSEGHPTSNLPLRAGKGWIYEGGLRVPLIVHWPGITDPGSVSVVPAVSHDFFPTMLEIAGLPLRPETHLDGVSLVPALRQEGEIGRDAICWHYPHYSNQGGSPASAIREGGWKLIEFFEGNRIELYHLDEDEGESHDMARVHPARVRAMHQRLRAWREEVDARYPSPNPDHDTRTGRRDTNHSPPGD